MISEASARPDGEASARSRRLRHVTLDRGPFELGDVVGDPAECYGLVVTEGFIVAEVQAARASTAWLIGADDVIRPWEAGELSLTREVNWRALRLTRLLRLDAGFYSRSRHDPQALQAIVAGAARTTHWLLAKSLIVSSPMIEERLLLLFGLYGERWGRVTRDGVTLDLPLTHELLAALCGARRPNVTHALRGLESKGLISCPARGSWVLHPPSGDELPIACLTEYASALGFDLATELA